MSPAIPDGSYVVATRWFRLSMLRPGQRVILNHDTHGQMIKTIEFIDRTGTVWCRGENPLSLSVAQIGPVNKAQILGRVLLVIPCHSSTGSARA